MELDEQEARITGRIEVGNVYVDGLSVGEVNSVILRDRQLLARDGIVLMVLAIGKNTRELVGEPNIMSMGFVDHNERDEMMKKGRQFVVDTLNQNDKTPLESSFINVKVKEALGKFFHEQTGRRPLILPVVVEV